MCGIAGWIDLRRDLTEQRRLLRAMTDTMDRRGPDASDVWTGGHAGLGVRRLSVVDLPGGVQPMVHPSDDGPVVLAYTGELFNFVELREELVQLGHRFGTASDTEVVLRSYLEWGRDCARRFNGMFAFAVWDARVDELTLIRDRFGIYPLHYLVRDDSVIFGSESKAILAHPQVRATVDVEGLREALTLVKTPGEAVYRGIRELPPGTMLCSSRAGTKLHRYWSLPAREHTDDLDTTISTIREILEDTVDRQVVADVPLGCFLSGGLDSSVITALASRALKRRQQDELLTFSVDFKDHAEHFKGDGVRNTMDEPFVQEMVRHLGTTHTTVMVGPEDLMSEENRRAALSARDLPTPLGDLYTSLYVLSRGVREGCTAALTGDASDEMFGGYGWFHDQHYRDTAMLPWVEASRRMPGANTIWSAGLLAPDLQAKLDLRSYEQDRYSEALAEVPVLDGEAPLDRRMREITYFNLTRYLQIILDRKDRMGMGASLEGRVPFCDHRLVEYVFNIPWAMKTFDGREKSLLRAATADLLPPSVRDREKAGYPVAVDPAYAARLRTKVAGILRSSDSPVRELLDTELTQRYLDDPEGPAAEQANRSSLEMVVQLDDWMRMYDVEVAL
ncbi:MULTISPECIES: asparagine synthase (glutamine-hydrolyzing) [Streptomyces]|uniref:asparagine synthase (glutamine-hydrolyzing) n=1 Tax=Streptomyces cacaoi TaxID=1898 RepID=A0A4Y3QQS6_STRCI|nr:MULTISPECIES: asparagine synthase (glutamine-hydrolyzing) [Streptomyces]ATJ34007.1 asparagine synthetase B [Streptomyces sp.]NNG88550.1 asparagine synthase (glutamine-hydrolyzing) [Streptomyces cacaoi]QHF95778.1 asparagine synthase (glutamine-hydrolyzing) [Streptomyces sp. NHF165]GEB47734.1 asparagine synthetase B [Streptomyces cacaoi]